MRHLQTMNFAYELSFPRPRVMQPALVLLFELCHSGVGAALVLVLYMLFYLSEKRQYGGAARLDRAKYFVEYKFSSISSSAVALSRINKK